MTKNEINVIIAMNFYQAFFKSNKTNGNTIEIPEEARKIMDLEFEAEGCLTVDYETSERFSKALKDSLEDTTTSKEHRMEVSELFGKLVGVEDFKTFLELNKVEIN
jgi:3-isopropylmalate dehydratase small subunit